MSPGTSEPDSAPRHRLFSSRNDCQAALREAIDRAADAGCRELWFCDLDYADWPLGERGVVESLTRWAYAHRKLTVLAARFDGLAQRHARWVAWRRQWAHVVECRALESLERSAVPSILLAPGVVSVRIVDRERHRGSFSLEAAQGLQCREQIDAAAQRSVEAFPATTLGL